MNQSGNDVAIVTGGASGMGRATVDLFLSNGLSVVVLDRNLDGLVDLKDNPRLRGLAGDVTSEADNAEAVALATGEFGHLDRVILNAGMPMSGLIDQLDLDLYDRGFDVNVRAVALGVRAALPALRVNRGGAIVATASISGFGGDPRRWAYSAAKAAVINMVQSLALTLAEENIRVNAVCPGPVATGMVEQVRINEPERYDALRRNVPMQRWGKPEELAEVFNFLSGPASSFVTGVAVPVDGGAAAQSGNYRAGSASGQ